MKTIKSMTTAWLTCGGDTRTLTGLEPDALINSLGYARGDMATHGWIAVGSAEISLTLQEPAALLTNQIESLRAQQRESLARAELFEQQIKNLLAITYDEPQPA